MIKVYTKTEEELMALKSIPKNKGKLMLVK